MKKDGFRPFFFIGMDMSEDEPSTRAVRSERVQHTGVRRTPLASGSLGCLAEFARRDTVVPPEESREIVCRSESYKGSDQREDQRHVGSADR